MRKVSVCNRTHIFLQMFFLLLAVSIFGCKPTETVTFHQQMLWAVSYYINLNILCYANIYILVSKYLLNKKYKMYCLWSFIYTFISLLALIYVNINTFVDLDIVVPSWILVANCVSSLITIWAIVASSSTLALLSMWWNDRKQAELLNQASVQAELNILKEQINPHFLFNTLNNVNVLLKRDAVEASKILFELEDLLRYQLKDCSESRVKLKSDILFLENYLRLEKIRRDNFEYNISVNGNIDNVMLSPLLFVTFVGNAVKHNAYGNNNAYVNVIFRRNENQLVFTCENSKSEEHQIASPRSSGLGLKNVRRRLELLYPDKYKLNIIDKGNVYFVKLILEL